MQLTYIPQYVTHIITQQAIWHKQTESLLPNYPHATAHYSGMEVRRCVGIIQHKGQSEEGIRDSNIPSLMHTKLQLSICETNTLNIHKVAYLGLLNN